MYGVILNELFVKSHRNKVSITMGNYAPFEGTVVDIKDGMVAVENNTEKMYFNIEDIDDLYVYDE